MPHRTERRLIARRPERELVQVRLADDDRPRSFEAAYHERIDNGVAGGHAGAGRCWCAGDVHQILHGDRDAVQRPETAAGLNLSGRVLRLFESMCTHHGDERVGLGARIDSGEASLDQINRGQHPAPDALCDIGDAPGLHDPWGSASAFRSAAVDRASASRSALNSGRFRPSESAIAAASQASTVILLERQRAAHGDRHRQEPVFERAGQRIPGKFDDELHADRA